MKKLLRSLAAVLMFSTLLTAGAQSVTTTPAIFTGSGPITITFHTDGGNRGLSGATQATEIYAHTGVITNLSQNGSDWKYAPTWGDNSAKYRLTYVEPFTWELKIDDVRKYYGITDPAEKVEKLAFVFRSADNSAEGKSATGGDIYVQVFPDNFPASQAANPSAPLAYGAVPTEDGMEVCLAAPDKQNVVLVGSWNDYALTPSQVMAYYDDPADGVRKFHTRVSGLKPGQDYCYYYIVDGTVTVGDPYARLVLDPWNDQYIPASVFPGLPAYPAHKVSATPLAIFNSQRDEYAWKTPSFKGVPQSDLIIYELLIRDFTGTEGKALGEGTVKGVIDKLDYLQELGVNAIELLPIMEFSGNNSWGYNTNFYMAPDKAYGTPDDYRALIDGAHERGMAVILDIVFNQSDGLHPWYSMYRRNISQMYNGSAPHAYSVLNDWNQSSPLVQRQWTDALTYWMQAYKVDGFRFDLVKGLGDNDSYGNTFDAATNTWGVPSDAETNKYNASRIARMKVLHDHIMSINPNAYFINEDLAGAQEENALAADGEINWANVNHNATNYVMGLVSGASLNRFYAPQDDKRLWGSTVSYAESHDEERVALQPYSDKNSVVRGSTANVMLRMGSMAAQMILSPGAHMIWQFEELGNNQTTKNADWSNDTSPKKVLWNYMNTASRRGLHDTFAALCKIRAQHPELFRSTASQKVELTSNSARYISLADGTKELYLVVNPAPKAPTETATIPFPTNPATGSTAPLGSGYELVTASYNTTPLLTATGVTLPAGTFAVYGKGLESGIDDVIADSSERPAVIVEDGMIRVLTPYTTLSVHTLSGMSVNPASRLAHGLYLVTVDGATVKVVI